MAESCDVESKRYISGGGGGGGGGWGRLNYLRAHIPV